MFHFGLAQAGMGDAGFEVAGDIMLGNQAFGDVLGLFGKCPEFVRILFADQRLERILFHALAGAELSAVAPGGAKADAVRLEQDHVIPPFRKVKRG